MSSISPLWTPSPERVKKTHMFAFMERIAWKHGIAAEWEALRQWSIDHAGRFWGELLEFVEVEPATPARRAVSGTGMLGTTWFDGMTLNYARHMLRFDGDEPAILAETERDASRSMSRRELRAEVGRCAAALRRDGVKLGDRVVGFMPNIPETVIAMLAAASLGATWSSCSPDFGVRGVLDRFGQIEPTVLVVTDGYTYNGKRFDSLERVRGMLADLPSVRRVIVVPFVEERPPLAGLREALLWRDYLGPETAPAPELEFAEVPFDHPLFIMYSSGTTGVPKCIIHGHGGTLLQHMKELMLHTDLHERERIFYFTTCGWMMWNWLVSGLGAGAAAVLFEGSPTHPTIDRLFEMTERLGIHVFGTSPKFLGACEKADLHPGREHDLAALRCVCSTGSPLSPEQFRWVYREIKADLQLSSICGGTDIISCFMLGNPLLPVYAGEAQCRGLGMDVQAWDGAGQPLIGEKGELVCTNPFPSQPVGFWNDANDEKYKAAYFEHYPGVWRHGDFIEVTERGGIIVYGRSDATLNPGGVRIGTAEIYRVVEGFSEITDSIVVPRPAPDNDVEIVLFVVLRAGMDLDDDLRKRIQTAIADGATRRHVPRRIFQVTDIPHTISGKKVEMAVAQLLRGEDVANRDALANPDSLEQFRSLL
ncbi:MAG: acetoacetate--CoA ligase [Phycisphaerae bacterium]|nr:acetoacetate--CoA ligase [Phycisphaerae bacterium]